MKRLTLIFVSVLLAVASSFARPALSDTVRVQQPDGSYVTIRLVGDEYRSFNTTADGYTLTRNSRGYYVYASLDADGRLAPTEFVARNAGERTAADQAYLERVGRGLQPAMTDANATAMRRNQAARQKVLEQRRAALYDYSKFRGLVILVEYNDCPFRYDDYGDIMTDMINQDNYTGESRTNVSSNVSCTGSMRDYFRDNSTGVFVPTFDIVGPVKINRSQYYARPNGSDGNDNYGQLMYDAVTAADGLVDFSEYDIDGDKVVDMVYFIFSGLASYIAGNDGRLLWPHQSDLRYRRTAKKDGVTIGRYACSTELYGSDTWSVLEGIGTMTHEFSHVLGLPDLYDTNNVFPDDNCVNPGAWSVMAGGADGNYGRTPINYSLYERYALGFATPQVITQPGTLSMESIDKCNTGFRLNTPVKKEFFLLENRQRNKWDSVLPGHGMLIFRVDSTNANAWAYNIINDNPVHPYYELVRAKGVQNATAYDAFPASPRDPFPGTGRVTAIDNETSPANLLTWAGKENNYGLRSISERNGVISFEAYYVNVVTSISIPDSVTMGFATQLQLTPALVPENAITVLTWTSDNEEVVTVDASGLLTAVSNGTATVTVTSDNGVTAQCHVTVKELESVPDIASFRALADSSAVQLTLTDAVVLFVSGDNVYVRDSTASIVLCATGLAAAQGDTLNGNIFGRLEHLNRMPRLTAVSNITTATNITVTQGTGKPSPLDVAAYRQDATLDDSMLNDYVSLRAATLVSENKMAFALVGEQKARIYNTFGLRGLSAPKSSAYAGRYYDVSGILTTDIVADSIIYMVSLTESVVEVEKPSDPDPVVGDVNGDGIVDVADIAAIINVMANGTEPQSGTAPDTESGTAPDTESGTAAGGTASNPADVNGDGVVDVADISSVISIMARS